VVVWQDGCSLRGAVDAVRTWPSRTLLGAFVTAVAVALLAVAGFCLFDTDGHHHDGIGFDLCTSILVVTIGTVLLVPLAVVGSTDGRIRWAATPAAVSVLDPPPWR
jgi:hypothetical protein